MQKFQRDPPSGSAAIPEKLMGGLHHHPPPPSLARVKVARFAMRRPRHTPPVTGLHDKLHSVCHRFPPVSPPSPADPARSQGHPEDVRRRAPLTDRSTPVDDRRCRRGMMNDERRGTSARVPGHRSPGRVRNIRDRATQSPTPQEGGLGDFLGGFSQNRQLFNFTLSYFKNS